VGAVQGVHALLMPSADQLPMTAGVKKDEPVTHEVAFAGLMAATTVLLVLLQRAVTYVLDAIVGVVHVLQTPLAPLTCGEPALKVEVK